MSSYLVSCSRGQMKVQQMAFVLVAIFIFFAMVSLVYFSIKITGVEQSVVELREEGAKELVKKLSGTPEFLSRECPNCIDLDKVFALKNRQTYQGFWNLDYLAVELIYPEREGECTPANYPDCRTITIINESIGSPSSAFVSVCRWEEVGGFVKCEVGKIFASGRGIK